MATQTYTEELRVCCLQASRHLYNLKLALYEVSRESQTDALSRFKGRVKNIQTYSDCYEDLVAWSWYSLVWETNSCRQLANKLAVILTLSETSRVPARMHEILYKLSRRAYKLLGSSEVNIQLGVYSLLPLSVGKECRFEWCKQPQQQNWSLLHSYLLWWCSNRHNCCKDRSN